MSSLTRIGDDKKPRRAIQFIDGHGDRKTINLGRIGEKEAKAFQFKVDGLIAATSLNQPPNQDTAEWLAKLPPRMYDRLAAVGLARPRSSMRLEEFLDRCIEHRRGLKASSLTKLRYTKDRLIEFFKPETPIRSITPDQARDWRTWLEQLPDKRKGKRAATVSESTVRGHCRNVKTFFNDAVECELIEKNPFRKLKSGIIAAKRERYVTPEETINLLAACPSLQWQVLFGLARLAGLRLPSETHILTWRDVDWQRGRLTVRSPKTERYEGKEKRVVPIVPQLMTILRDAFEAAEDGQLKIVTLSTNNLRRAFICIIKRAGLEPWEDVFQTLRRSRETEWSLEYPPHVVSEWVGHSVKVSADHYLQVPDSLMDRAAGNTVTMGSQASESDAPAEGAPESPAEPASEDNSSHKKGLNAPGRAAKTTAQEPQTLQNEGQQASAPDRTDSQEFDVTDGSYETLRDYSNSRGRARTADLGVMKL